MSDTSILAAIEASVRNLPEKCATLFGVDVNAVILIFSIFVAFPTNLLYTTVIKRLASPSFRCLYFFLVGFTTILACYGVNCVHFLICCCFTYAVVVLFRPKHAIFINGLVNFGYLLCGYYLNQQDWKYSLTWTMPQCVLALRLIAFTFDVYDGSLKANDADNKEHARHTVCAIPRVPTFFEYISYCYYPGSLMVGPLVPFVTFQKFVRDSSGFNSQAFYISVARLFFAVVCMLLHVIGSIYFPIEYLQSNEFFNGSFFWKLTAMAIVTKICMYKYIFAWMLAESSNILSGITYDGNNYYNHCNINLSKYELTNSFSTLISAWNMTTNQFAFRYIYRRLKFLGNIYMSQFATLSFLALWHGVASGYWFAFSAEFLILFFEKHLSKVTKRVEELHHFQIDRYKLPLWILGRIYTFYFMGYSFVSFMFLFHEFWVPVLGSVHYIGHVLLIVYILLSIVINRVLHIS